jgi:hypothetical protein
LRSVDTNETAAARGNFTVDPKVVFLCQLLHLPFSRRKSSHKKTPDAQHPGDDIHFAKWIKEYGLLVFV